ncbi:MAG TPA: hypothetical protein VHO07_23100 [Streptosporangiaceae bacterium]|nr:hypothetical protein [Streptosporangiaceae bacterium]
MDAPARGVRGLPPGYREWQPPAALRPVVSCLWAHLTRECGQLAGLTPAALARQRVCG